MVQLIKEKVFGISPIFTFKMLAACVSVALFALLSILVGTLILGGGGQDVAIMENDAGLIAWGYIVLLFAGVFIVVSAVYVLLGILPHFYELKKYRKIYRWLGIGSLLLLFIAMGIWEGVAIVLLGGAALVTGVSIFLAGLLAFAPILSVWWVDDEVRLQNFLTALARVCATLTFIGGGCVFLLNSMF